MKRLLVRKADPLLTKMTLLDDAQTGALITRLREARGPVTVGFLNQHGYNLAQQSPEVHHNFLQLDCLLRDGIGIELACRLHGIDGKANLNGSDFIPRLVDNFLRDRQVPRQFFAMGTEEPWLSQGARGLFRDQPFHGIDGFRPLDEYLAFFQAHHRPGHFPVIILAMGMPKQELVAQSLRRSLGVPAVIVCGGAILDFSAGRFPRAPALLRRAGLEWLYRLSKEPRRLFGRYVVGIPLFFANVAGNALGRGAGLRRWLPAERKR